MEELEERVAKLKEEVSKVVKKINEFDMENGSIEELVQYEKLLKRLQLKTAELLDDIDIEILLENVTQSLIDEGYIKYE